MRARAKAVSNPIPELAPVTTTVLPDISRGMPFKENPFRADTCLQTDSAVCLLEVTGGR
jgi:hypothetical protein